MILKKKIPKEFYKLFRTKNRDAYMQFLVAIYEENNEVYTALGLTIEECRVIIADTIAKWIETDVSSKKIVNKNTEVEIAVFLAKKCYEDMEKYGEIPSRHAFERSKSTS